MSKVNSDKKDMTDFFSIIGIILSIVSIVVASWSAIQNNRDEQTNRRVDTYTEAIVSLETLRFHGFSAGMEYAETMNSEIDDQWVKNQVLDAVRIKAELEILDKGKAVTYWEIISQIFGEEHKFDEEKYETLKSDIMNEL